MPELISSDRIHLAPHTATHAPATLSDEENSTDAENANGVVRRDEHVFDDARKIDPEAGYGTRDFIIDRLTAEGIDDAGAPVFRVRWKGYSPRDDTSVFSEMDADVHNL